MSPCGAAVLPANATLKNGTGTFSVTLNTAGNQTITATDTANSTIKGVSGNILVSAVSTAEKLVFFVQPSNGRAGVLDSVVVLVENAKGQIVTSDHSSVTLTVASGPGTLGGTFTIKTAFGVALFNNLSLTKAGVYTLKATDGSDTNTTSHAFTITAASPAKLVITQQPGNATAGATVSQVVVTEEDQFGNINTDDSFPVTLSLAKSPSNAKLNGTVSERGNNGVPTSREVNAPVGLASSLHRTNCSTGALDVVRQCLRLHRQPALKRFLTALERHIHNSLPGGIPNVS